MRIRKKCAYPYVYYIIMTKDGVMLDDHGYPQNFKTRSQARNYRKAIKAAYEALVSL
jgi:hypothetical protein